MTTTEALDLLHQGQSLEDVVLLDLETQKLGFRDALLLTEHALWCLRKTSFIKIQTSKMTLILMTPPGMGSMVN